MRLDLDLVKLVFTLRLQHDETDRFSLFGIRPHFEEAFRILAECRDPDRCAGGEDCLYHRTFAQTLSADPAAIKRYQKPSLPFVFQVPVLPPPPNALATVELGLILAGTAIPMLADYLFAVDMMCAIPGFARSNRIFLVKVECEDSSGGRTTLPFHRGDKDVVISAPVSLWGFDDAAVLDPEKVTVHLVTPLRLLTEGRPLKQLSFSPFIRALLRRVSSMVYYFGGSEPDWDFKWLAERSHAVETVAGGLRWEEKGHRWSGITGTVTFSGRLADYHPFLAAGELVGVGKGATFGFGRYFVERSAASCK